MKRSEPLKIKKETSNVTRQKSRSSLEGMLLSKSLGDAPRLAEIAAFHRRSSEGSKIRYSGYLLKRSNKPFRQMSEFPAADIAMAEASGVQSKGAIPTAPFGTDHFSQHIRDESGESAGPKGQRQVSLSFEEQESLPPTERSLQAAASFFGYDSQNVRDTDLANKLDKASDAETEFGRNGYTDVRRAVVSPDQPDSYLLSPRPQAYTTPLHGSGADPFSSATTRTFSTVPYFRNDSAPASFSVLDQGVSHERSQELSNPVDHVDPQDGHIWRAKYCVLEDGVLYFYRNVSDGESLEAQAERAERECFSNGADDSSSVDDIADLSKSPMPRTKMMPLSRTGIRDGIAARSSGDCSNVIWEKRVELERVGAVRSAELEYGQFSFELIAVADGGANRDPDASGNQDPLVLRASNMNEMNAWLFEFHRSLASVMRHIMQEIESSPSAGKGIFARVGDIAIYPPLAPPFADDTVASMHGLSPAARFRPPLQVPVSLSHGHGRSRVHRRKSPLQQQSDRKSAEGSLSPDVHSESPSDLTVGGFSSLTKGPPRVTPTSEFKQAGPLTPVATPNSKFSGEGMATALQEPERPIIAEGHIPKLSTKALSKGKYTPPQLRNKIKQADGPGVTKNRYIPPHLRKQQNVSAAKPLTEMNGDLPFEIEDTLSSDAEGVGASYIEDAIEQTDSSIDTPAMKLGGCADPMVAVGSILEFPLYRDRKASRIGKVHTDSFGCFGGGPSTQSDSLVANLSDVGGTFLRWEVGAVSECGVRDSNEDSYLVASDLMKAFQVLGGEETISSQGLPSLWTKFATHQPGLFAIFDGHCENQAARFAAEKMTSFLHAESLFHDEADGSVSKISDVLTKSISSLDNTFCRLCTADGREWDSGSTALIAVLVQDHLVVANLGDCRGVLCSSASATAQHGNDSIAIGTVLLQEGWSLLEFDDDENSADDKWIRATGDGVNGEERQCFWKEVVETHSPSREDERRRIEDANGWITTEREIPIGQLQRMDFCDEDVIDILKRCFSDRYQSSQDATPSKKCNSAPQRILDISRVCGELSVSRALGDRDFKAAFNEPANKKKESEALIDRPDDAAWDCPLYLLYPDEHSQRFFGDLVSPIPETQTIRVGREGVDNEFLLLACDGLWDVMDPDDAVRVTHGLLYEKKWSARKAAARLAEIAIHLGSSDNITVIVIRLFTEQQEAR